MSTKVFSAAFEGDRRLLESRLRKGADVNARDEEGSTLLMHACQGAARPELVEWLVSEGADVNA